MNQNFEISVFSIRSFNDGKKYICTACISVNKTVSMFLYDKEVFVFFFLFFFFHSSLGLFLSLGWVSSPNDSCCEVLAI
jgi:hypothetical protein